MTNLVPTTQWRCQCGVTYENHTMQHDTMQCSYCKKGTATRVKAREPSEARSWMMVDDEDRSAIGGY